MGSWVFHCSSPGNLQMMFTTLWETFWIYYVVNCLHWLYFLYANNEWPVLYFVYFSHPFQGQYNVGDVKLRFSQWVPLQLKSIEHMFYNISHYIYIYIYSKAWIWIMNKLPVSCISEMTGVDMIKTCWLLPPCGDMEVSVWLQWKIYQRSGSSQTSTWCL